MNSLRLSRYLPIAPFLLIICTCGGGGGSGGSTTPPPTTTEVLYASNIGNEIFGFEIDQSGGTLTQTANVSPGFSTDENTAIAVTPAGTFLYAVNDSTSGINGYSTSKSGTLSLISGSPFQILPNQPPLRHVQGLVIDPTGRFLYAGTGGGIDTPVPPEIASFSIDSSSGALAATGGPFSIGNGVVGGIAINPVGTFLYATDQYQSVSAFSIDSQAGTLTLIPGSPFNTGAVPSGLQVDPSGHFLYVALGQPFSIAAFTIDSASGALTTIHGSPFSIDSSAVGVTANLITIHPSGRFLYTFDLTQSTNGLPAGLSAFTIDSTTGALSLISGSPFSVSPPAFAGLIVDPSGKFLYLAAGEPPIPFVIFDIDSSTGTPSESPIPPAVGTQSPVGLATASFR